MCPWHHGKRKTTAVLLMPAFRELGTSESPHAGDNTLNSDTGGSVDAEGLLARSFTAALFGGASPCVPSAPAPGTTGLINEQQVASLTVPCF